VYRNCFRLDNGANCPGYTEDTIASIGNCGGFPGDGGPSGDTGSNDSGSDGGDTGNTSTNTGNNTNGGQTSNGGSDNDTNNDATTPTTTCKRDCLEEFDPIHDENCQELQKLLDIDTDSVPSPYKTLKEAIADLKGDLDEDSEEGYTFIHNSHLDQLLAKVSSSNTGEGYCNYLATPNVYGGIHLHVDNEHPNVEGHYEPMFSHGDIKDLLEFTESYDNPNNPPNSSLFVHMLVSYQGTYAIKINDLTKLQQLNAIWDDKDQKDDFELYLDIAYRKKTDNFANPNGTDEDYQKIFLKYVNLKYDLGISLFKTKENTNGEPIGWEELTLIDGNTANSSIVKKPCD